MNTLLDFVYLFHIEQKHFQKNEVIFEVNYAIFYFCVKKSKNLWEKEISEPGGVRYGVERTVTLAHVKRKKTHKTLLLKNKKTTNTKAEHTLGFFN